MKFVIAHNAESYWDGRFGAGQTYSEAEPLPTAAELAASHAEYLTADGVDAGEAELRAADFARGYLDVARPMRRRHELERARELVAELASVAADLSAVWEASGEGVGLALERAYPKHLGDFREVVANLQAWRDVL